MPKNPEYHLQERLDENLFAVRLGKWIDTAGGVRFDHGKDRDPITLLKTGDRRIWKTRSSVLVPDGARHIRTVIAVDALNHTVFGLIVDYRNMQVRDSILCISRSASSSDRRRLMMPPYVRGAGRNTVLLSYAHRHESGWSITAVESSMNITASAAEVAAFTRAGMPGGACLVSNLPAIDYEKTVLAMKHQVESFLAHPASLAQGEIPVPLVLAGSHL
jgi:hypothetical protein